MLSVKFKTNTAKNTIKIELLVSAVSRDIELTQMEDASMLMSTVPSLTKLASASTATDFTS